MREPAPTWFVVLFISLVLAVLCGIGAPLIIAFWRAVL
jgi:hypothetical protein